VGARKLASALLSPATPVPAVKPVVDAASCAIGVFAGTSEGGGSDA
jgi:hypothetical protein